MRRSLGLHFAQYLRCDHLRPSRLRERQQRRRPDTLAQHSVLACPLKFKL